MYACGYHYVVSAEKRVRLLVDPGTFKPLRCKVAFSNPLDMPEYEEKIERLQEKNRARRGCLYRRWQDRRKRGSHCSHEQQVPDGKYGYGCW